MSDHEALDIPLLPIAEIQRLLQLCLNTAKTTYAKVMETENPFLKDNDSPGELKNLGVTGFAHTMFSYYLEHGMGYTNVMQLNSAFKRFEKERKYEEYEEFLRLSEMFNEEKDKKPRPSPNARPEPEKPDEGVDLSDEDIA